MRWLRDIPGFEGKYAVDMGGNVYSYRKGTYLKPGMASGGYLTVSLGRRRSRCVHELILTTFVGPRPSPKHVSRHLDGDKLHNCIFNLEWATYSRNALDKKYLNEHGPNLSIQQVLEIKDLVAGRYPIMRIAEQYGVSKSTVHAIMSGQNHKDVQ